MKDKSNNNISKESDGTKDINLLDDMEDINLLLDDFKAALKKEYIIPIINKMIYIIQNNVTSEIVDELNFNHNHSLIKVAKIHEEFEYLKFCKNMLIHI